MTLPFDYSPKTGVNDTTQFPDDDPQIRAHIQALLDQIKDCLNNDVKTELDNKANKDSETMTNLTATGFINNAYTKKTDGNGAGIFNIDNSLIILYAVDQGTPANYIMAMGYKAIGVAPVLSVIKNNVLTLGASNSGGTQVINGGTADYITAYSISIPR